MPFWVGRARRLRCHGKGLLGRSARAHERGGARADRPPGGKGWYRKVRAHPDSAAISEKLRGLLRIAAAVQRGDLEVSADDVAAARQEGATDVEIHDTVLVVAAFCMFNRYVDRLATIAPQDRAVYAKDARFISEKAISRRLSGGNPG